MTQEVDFHGAVAGYIGHLIAGFSLKIGCAACNRDLSIPGTSFHTLVRAPGEVLQRVEVEIRCGSCMAVLAAENSPVELHDGNDAHDSFRATVR